MANKTISFVFKENIYKALLILNSILALFTILVSYVIFRDYSFIVKNLSIILVLVGLTFLYSIIISFRHKNNKSKIYEIIYGESLGSNMKIRIPNAKNFSQIMNCIFLPFILLTFTIAFIAKVTTHLSLVPIHSSYYYESCISLFRLVFIQNLLLIISLSIICYILITLLRYVKKIDTKSLLSNNPKMVIASLLFIIIFAVLLFFIATIIVSYFNLQFHIDLFFTTSVSIILTTWMFVVINTIFSIKKNNSNEFILKIYLGNK